MALYALDGDDVLYALEAHRKKRYRCMECSGPVQLKQGVRRTPHFYHVKKSSRCRLYGKSETHHLLQMQIKNILAPEEITVERPFPSIRRIADLFWEKEKIVFEIQCSPIRLEEAVARMADYGMVGCRVVWLMSERVFNRKWISPSEAFLRENGGLFFRFEQKRLVFIYDQIDVADARKRLGKSAPLVVNLSRPRPMPVIPFSPSWPLCVVKRLDTAALYFPSDLADQAILSVRDQAGAARLAYWKGLEASPELPKRSWLKRGVESFRSFCHAGLNFLLEKTHPR